MLPLPLRFPMRRLWALVAACTINASAQTPSGLPEPLLVRSETGLPRDVTTVWGAVAHVLRHTGFHLASTADAKRWLATAPVAEVHRHLGPDEVWRLVHRLLGPSWQMVVDPVRRTVALRLTDAVAAELRQDARAHDLIPRSVSLPSTERDIRFQVHAGSLHAAIAQLASVHGWTLVDWDRWVSGRSGERLDWRIPKSFFLKEPTFEIALAQLIAPYGLKATLHEADHTVVVTLGVQR